MIVTFSLAPILLLVTVTFGLVGMWVLAFLAGHYSTKQKSRLFLLYVTLSWVLVVGVMCATSYILTTIVPQLPQ